MGQAGQGSELLRVAPGSLHPTPAMGPAELPSSSPRPDIGEVYADRVLLVWKPVESYGPVTYIVQCSLEGRAAPLPSRPGGPGVSGGEQWGSASLVGALDPIRESPGPSASLGGCPGGGVSPPNSGGQALG